MSDAFGALSKSAYERGILREPDNAPRNAQDAVDLIRRHLTEFPENLGFLHVMVAPPFTEKESPPSIQIKGIRKLHSLVRRPDGSLIGSRLSCLTCTISTLCDQCRDAAPLVTQSKVAEVLEEIPVEVERVESVETDEEGGDSDCEDDGGHDSGVATGDYVWAKFKRWIPSVVLPLTEVPLNIQAKLKGNPEKPSLFVKRLTDNDVRRVFISKMEELAENSIDHFRSLKSDEICIAYNMAISKKKGEPVV